MCRFVQAHRPLLLLSSQFDVLLGRGAFKIVYKAMDLEEGKEVAWNQVRCSDFIGCALKDRDEDRERLFAEIRVLKALKHKNIMSIYDSWLDAKQGNINFITELFTSGTLRQYRKRHRHIDDEVLKRWAWQILCGLVYLHGHSPPIIHRDLKCDNIFINGSDGVVKIGDLGLATMLRSRTAPQSVLGTPEFMAPELYEEEYDDRVDVYSFGMCLLELATMEYPYSECQNAAQIYRKVSLGVRPAGLQKIVSSDLREFINMCIGSRDQRPRSRQLLKHPYFESVRAGAGMCGGLQVTKSEVALAGHSSTDALPMYISSNPVSRTTSDVMTAMNTPASVLQNGTLARTISAVTDGSTTSAPAEMQTGMIGSDGASVRSQRSNASEMAAAHILADILEEDEHGSGTVDVGDVDVPHPITKAASAAGSPGRTSPTGGSRAGSPHSTPSRKNSPAPDMVYDGSSRNFVVLGKYQEANNKFNLRLKIRDPDGQCRTVEFEFDLSMDTATDVAMEMVRDLQLSGEDAVAIASAIKNEVSNLSSHLEQKLSESLEVAAAALQQGLEDGALMQQEALNEQGEESKPAEKQRRAAALPPAGPSAASLRELGSFTSLVSAKSKGSGASLLSQASSTSSQSMQSAQSHVVADKVLSPAGSFASISLAGTATNGHMNSEKLVRSSSFDPLLFKGARTALLSSAVNKESISPYAQGPSSQGHSSGALSPHSGLLSPQVNGIGNEKRFPLHQLLFNLNEVAEQQRQDGSITPPPLNELRVSAEAGTELLEKCSPLAAPNGSVDDVVISSSSPIAISKMISPREGRMAQSTPVSKRSSREASPQSRSNGAGVLLSPGVKEMTEEVRAMLIGAKKKDKAVRQQMSTAKLSELAEKSLSCLEVGLGAARTTRGTPMAANKTLGGVAASAGIVVAPTATINAFAGLTPAIDINPKATPSNSGSSNGSVSGA